MSNKITPWLISLTCRLSPTALQTNDEVRFITFLDRLITKLLNPRCPSIIVPRKGQIAERIWYRLPMQRSHYREVQGEYLCLARVQWSAGRFFCFSAR